MLAALSDSDKTFLGVVIVALLAPTWLAWWNARIAKRQVTPNGGSSLKDQVTKLGQQVTMLCIKMDSVVATQELHSIEVATVKAVQHNMQEVQQEVQQVILRSQEQATERYENDHPDVPPTAA